MSIDKDGKELFHQQLHTILLDQIKNGTLVPGQKIPSERDLSEIYGVSRTTAKTAVLRLLNEGLVVRATGKGTFIRKNLGSGKPLTQQTGNIAFVLNKRKDYRVPLVEDAVYRNLSQTIQTIISSKDMHMMIATIDDQDVGEVNSYEALVEKVDGVIIAEPRSLVLAEYAQQQLKPVIVVAPSLDHLPFESVDIDNEQAGFQATRYLIELGHRKIAFIKGPENILATQFRFSGFRRAIETASLSIEDELITSGVGWTIEDGEAAFELLNKRENEYTAIVCANDLLAIGVLRSAKVHGVLVPDDLSVIGCDNIELSNHSDPPLTTMDTHIRSIGNVAAKRLMELISSGESLQHKTLLPATTIERESCRKI
mgnify:CR=1 FL=1